MGLLGSSSRAREVEIRLADNFQCVDLSDDALAEECRERENGGNFVLHHFSDRNSGPCRNYFADNLSIHGDANHGRFALQ